MSCPNCVHPETPLLEVTSRLPKYIRLRKSGFYIHTGAIHIVIAEIDEAPVGVTNVRILSLYQ